LGGSLRVERGVNGIGTSVHACVPTVAPGIEQDSATSGAMLAASALVVMENAAAPAVPAEEAELSMRNQMRNINDLQSQLAALAPLQAAGGGAAPIMRVQRPSADGHTRF